MDVLQIVLSGASDDEAIGDAQGVPTSMSRGKFESAPVIVSGDPTTIVPGVAPLARSAPGAGTITAGRPSPWHGTQGFEEAGYGRLRPRPRRPGRSPASLPRGAAAGDQAVGRPL